MRSPSPSDRPPRPPTPPRDIPALVTTRVRRRISARVRPRAAVLLYHRIATPSIDTWQLSVSPATFERQVAYLASEWQPMALQDLLAAARGGKLPDKAVALTFDDGYLDNLDHAVPILERYGVPATVYVATGYVGDQRLFWWDELERLLMDEARPERIDVSIAGVVVEGATSTSLERAVALTRIQGLMRRGPAAALEPALQSLRAWAGKEPEEPMVIPRVRAVTPDELLRLAASPAIDIGAHSRTHPGLATQTLDVLRDEIEGSRDDLAALLGQRPASFSYPLGDQRPTTRRVVRAAGFQSAVAVLEAPTTRFTNPLEIPRVMAVEGPDELYAARLEALVD